MSTNQDDTPRVLVPVAALQKAAAHLRNHAEALRHFSERKSVADSASALAVTLEVLARRQPTTHTPDRITDDYNRPFRMDSAVDVLAPAAVGSTIYVQVIHPQGADHDPTRPPEGKWEATVTARDDAPPFFTLTVLAVIGWTFTMAGNTETGETMLTGWRYTP